jgi:ceramide glucosyltransferase
LASQSRSVGGKRTARCRPGRLPPVSVLKPLCGAEPQLYENLATFCEQAYPRTQLLFGVSSAEDPAIAVVERLRAAYPGHDITLVINPVIHGRNLKVSSLINLMAQARHELIVIADSDIAVGPDYLASVLAPLAHSDVGIVTCLYRARSIGGFWSRLGALFINQWFAPSVHVAHAGGSTRFGFGATLALRRATLEQIGGLGILRDELADDYWLVQHVRKQGLRMVLSEMKVTTDVVEPDLGALWAREMRWLRTIRSLNPSGYMFLFITFTSPWLLVCAYLAQRLQTAGVAGHAWPVVLLHWSLGSGLAARFMLHVRSSCNWQSFWRDLPLVPLRDGLLTLQWFVALFGSEVVWRNARLTIDSPASSTFEVSDGT